jgi:hypothetical protein
MTARSHETIRVGLRRVIRDPGAKPNVRMRAIELLMRVEGLMEEAAHLASSKDKPAGDPLSEHNANRMKELLAEIREQDSA